MPINTKNVTPAEEKGIDPFSRVWGEMRAGTFQAFHWGALCRQQNPARYLSEVHARLLMTYVSRLERRKERGLSISTDKIWYYGRDGDYSPQRFSVMPLYQNMPPLVFVGIGQVNGPFLPLRSRFSYNHQNLLSFLFEEGAKQLDRSRKPLVTYYSFLQKAWADDRHHTRSNASSILPWWEASLVLPTGPLLPPTERVDKRCELFLRETLGDPLLALPRTHQEAEEQAEKLLAVWLRHNKALS